MSPVCLPGEHAMARAYVAEIELALGQAGWSPSQRGRLRALRMKWMWRAEGRDEQFEQYGTFFRPPGTAPPTVTDVTVEKWRRRGLVSQEERKRRRVPWRVMAAARERARYK